MENKLFPEQEDNSFLPEEMPEMLPDTAQQEIIQEDPVAEPAEDNLQELSEVPAEDAEDTLEHDLLTSPDIRDEITPDEHAMAWHGMTHPTDPEPVFDLSILDDPEFDEHTEPETPEEAVEEVPFQEYSDDPAAFEEVFNAPAEEPKTAHDRPVRKGRPKRKKGEILFGLPQILVTFVWLAVILAIGVTMGRMLWVCAADVLAFGREDKAVTVTIYETDTIDDIADKLHKNDLIQYPGLFKLYASFAVDEGEIDPGIWDLNTRYDYHALVNMMSTGSTRSVVEDLLIPEGYTCRQIFELLEENKVCTAQDLAAYAASGELSDFWFLEGVERGTENCLEGFLFPDTYDFYKNSTPREVLDKLLSNFDHRFTEEMRAQMDTLNANVTGGTFDIHDVIIVASMIEKETANNEESPKIASVIYNRLFDWGGTPAYLNIDASIIYALDGKTDLTSEDMRVDSPYNTYLNVGLTPGPISNPGLASIKAALNPASTDFYYYVLNPAVGTHQFSKTLEEHEGYVAQFNAE